MLDELLGSILPVAPNQVEIPILQPADPFLETAGEDLRRRIYITRSTLGETLCLRPEFTIPICQAHVISGSAISRYAYGGPVFRQERAGASEFLQVGMEDLGDGNIVDADVLSINTMLSALQSGGVDQPKLVLGDQNLFDVVVRNLQLPSALARRLVRNFGSPEQLDRLIIQISNIKSEKVTTTPAQLLAAANDRQGLEEHICGLMEEARIMPQSGRSPAAIASRMIEKTLEWQFKLSGESTAVLRKFLDIETVLDKATGALEDFAKDTGIQFGEAGELFVNRVSALHDAGVQLDEATYRASFGRNLEYYSGVLFEASHNGQVIAGGGRYDHLCTLLGSESPVPAVGFSVYLDRMGAAL